MLLLLHAFAFPVYSSAVLTAGRSRLLLNARFAPLEKSLSLECPRHTFPLVLGRFNKYKAYIMCSVNRHLISLLQYCCCFCTAAVRFASASNTATAVACSCTAVSQYRHIYGHDTMPYSSSTTAVSRAPGRVTDHGASRVPASTTTSPNRMSTTLVAVNTYYVLLYL